MILAVDTELATLAEVEHVVLDLGPLFDGSPDCFICTHMVTGGRPHYAMTFDGLSEPDLAALRAVLADRYPAWATVGLASDDAPPNLPDGLTLAVNQQRDRDGGRAIRFPGWQRFVGRVPAREVIAGSAVDRLHVLGSSATPDDVELDTRGFVRPLWRQGELVLPVLPASPGLLAPFEVPNPTPCCGEHA